MNNLNVLSGRHLFDARKHIGLSLASTAKMTGINRNILSQFEQEKSKLSAQEKKQLVSFYEERGYDFNAPVTSDIDSVKQTYEATQKEVKQAASAVMSGNITSEALADSISKFADSVDDLVVVHGLVDATAVAKPEMEEITLPDEHYQLHQSLLEHFESDKAGKTKGKVGLLSEDGDERSAKLMALLAKQYLNVLHAENPEAVSINLDELTESNSDNVRLLKYLDENLALNALNEFPSV